MSLEEIPVEVLISYAKLDEDSVKVLTPKDDGTIEYTYYRKDESGGSDNSAEEVTFRVFTRDADGIMKGMEYIIKK